MWEVANAYWTIVNWPLRILALESPSCSALVFLRLAPIFFPPPEFDSLGSRFLPRLRARALVNMASEGMILTNHDHQIRVGVLTGKWNISLNPLGFTVAMYVKLFSLVVHVLFLNCHRVFCGEFAVAPCALSLAASVARVLASDGDLKLSTCNITWQPETVGVVWKYNSHYSVAKCTFLFHFCDSFQSQENSLCNELFMSRTQPS